MSKSLNLVLLLAGLCVSAPAQAQDADAGQKIFKKCKACHAVGDGARNKVGPHLNGIFGRVAGGGADYKYSKAMVQAGDDGLIWDVDTLAAYLEKPKAYIKGTKMSFAGLRKDKDVANVTAYLQSFSMTSSKPEAEPSGSSQSSDEVVAVATTEPVSQLMRATHGQYHLGRIALPEEILAWDIDVRPDGMGLPDGRGNVARGGELYDEQCAVCHGAFGEGEGRWPVLAGGQGTLKDERPEKTIGSYWPYLSTVFDYVHRAMPFGNAQSLSNDDVYALTAYLLYLNDIVSDEEFELSKENFNAIRLPNEGNFVADSRPDELHYTAQIEPCMQDCKPQPAEVIMRARVLDVTPQGQEGETTGAIE